MKTLELDDADWIQELLGSSVHGKVSQLKWDRFLHGYGQLGEVDCYFHGDDDDASGQVPDFGWNGWDQNEEPEISGCNCGVQPVSSELVALAGRLNEGSLGSIDPQNVTPGQIIHAGYRYGFKHAHWHLLLSNASCRIERFDGAVQIHVSCIGGHRGVIQWTEALSWHLPRSNNWRKQPARDSGPSLLVKTLYDYRCQLCSMKLESPAGPIAEASHIWEVHDGGPDVLENLLCLCPNCHARFDRQGWSLEIINHEVLSYDFARPGSVNIKMLSGHRIELEYVIRRNAISSA